MVGLGLVKVKGRAVHAQSAGTGSAHIKGLEGGEGGGGGEWAEGSGSLGGGGYSV